MRMGIFFSFLFFSKNGEYFPTKKKNEGKKKERPPYWLKKRTPAGPETEVFFRVAPCPTVCGKTSDIMSVSNHVK